MSWNPDPFFGPQHLPNDSRDASVAWVDLMGVADGMEHHTDATAVNIGKFYVALAERFDLSRFEVFPMADGVYIISEDLDDLVDNLSALFYRFSRAMIQLQEDGRGIYLGYMVRAGIGEGGVSNGADVDPNGETTLSELNWFDGIPFGVGVAKAYAAEGLAPFSIRYHESMDFVPYSNAMDDERRLRWFERMDGGFNEDLMNFVDEYLDYYEGQTLNNNYPDERIDVHRNRAREFLVDS